MAVRGEGEFVGEMGVMIDANGKPLPLPGAPGHQVLRAQSQTRPRVTGEEQSPPVASESTREHEDREGNTRRLETAWLTPISVTKQLKKWIGARRTATVRAATEVEALVLKKTQMQWVLVSSCTEPPNPRTPVKSLLCTLTQTHRQMHPAPAPRPRLAALPQARRSAMQLSVCLQRADPRCANQPATGERRGGCRRREEDGGGTYQRDRSTRHDGVDPPQLLRCARSWEGRKWRSS